MQIFIFILLLFAVGILRSIPIVLQNSFKKSKNVNYLWFALVFSVGFSFILPLILNWYLNFLFEFTFNYWIAFALLIVLGVFTNNIKND